MKYLDEPKCPWCGNRYDYYDLTSGYTLWRKIYARCKKCKNYGRLNFGSIQFLVTIVILSVVLDKCNHFFGGEIWQLILLLGIAIFMFVYYRLSYVRCRKGERWREDAMPETYLGRANIHWYPFWKNGVGLPFFRLADNRVFLRVLWMNLEKQLVILYALESKRI